MNDFEAKQEIRQVMLFHRGLDNAISRRELCVTLGWEPNSTNDRYMRKLITELRRGDSNFEPLAILSGGDGYYLPVTRKDIDEGLKFLRSYVIDACITIRALKVGSEREITGDKQEAML